MYITNQIPLSVKLLDFTVYDNAVEIHIAALSLKTHKTLANAISSDQFLHIKVVGNNCTTNEIAMKYAYTSIDYLNEKNLIAVPFKKIDFEIVTLGQSETFQITRTIQTRHLLKYFQVQVYSSFFVTFGIGGLVVMWDSDTFQEITSFVPHNKHFGGVRKCVADANRRFLHP